MADMSTDVPLKEINCLSFIVASTTAAVLWSISVSHRVIIVSMLLIFEWVLVAAAEPPLAEKGLEEIEGELLTGLWLGGCVNEEVFENSLHASNNDAVAGQFVLRGVGEAGGLQGVDVLFFHVH